MLGKMKYLAEAEGLNVRREQGLLVYLKSEVKLQV